MTYTDVSTYHVVYTDGTHGDVEADHMYAGDWCVVFCDERDNPIKIIHANAVHDASLKPQTH